MAIESNQVKAGGDYDEVIADLAELTELPSSSIMQNSCSSSSSETIAGVMWHLRTGAGWCQCDAIENGHCTRIQDSAFSILPHSVRTAAANSTWSSPPDSSSSY